MGVAPIKMPQLGESVTEGTVDKWLKKEGDFVKRDEPLVEVITDKVNAEIPSPFEGTLVRISVPEGETVAIGVEIAQIETDAEVPTGPVAVAPAETPAPTTPAPAEAAPAAATPPAPKGDRPRFSPAVRRLAEEHGLDPSTINGSGEGGRVTRDDVLAYVAAGGPPATAPAAAESAPAEPAPAAAKSPAPAAATAPAAAPGAREELVKLSPMRRSIAEHMVRSLATSPHAWTLQEIDMTSLVQYRESEKEGFRARNGIPLTYLPFVLQVTCDALKEFPHLNSTWTDDGVLLKHYVNMGIAVAVPDGLIVPVIKDADQLGFVDLARTMNDLAERARSKHLKPDDVQGGTFTLNNTGSTGSIAGMPIINQPQAAILSTERIVRRPVVIGEGIAIRHMMNMCMSFDHRIVDGEMAGGFIGSIKRRLEAWTPADIRI
jgi:pyruvate/2-oxoglutarate dehydrogenase complex dihydrolipoamide acyltransferase (E2) component